MRSPYALIYFDKPPALAPAYNSCAVVSLEQLKLPANHLLRQRDAVALF